MMLFVFVDATKEADVRAILFALPPSARFELICKFCQVLVTTTSRHVLSTVLTVARTDNWQTPCFEISREANGRRASRDDEIKREDMPSVQS
mmetsp:Transcript_38958/g.81880  ORF Transcript_38958/g.81880 Transcript_38958/m.81880 type:complete len:92 (+) Transcript_38958:2342-2617(+)